MNFDSPNAVSVMNTAVADVGDDGDAWEVIGDPLTKPIDEVLPAYNEKLDLKLKPSPGEKRLEICGLVWGRIEKDAARLNGLAAAIDNISSVVKSGKERLAHDWKGEAFDNFRLAIEKVETTLNDYSAAVKVAAADIKSAMDSVRSTFGTYQHTSLTNHFAFGDLAPPGDWRRMSEGDGEHLAENCTSWHGSVAVPIADQNCCYNDDEQVGIIKGKLVNRRLFDRLVSWDCTDDAGVVTAQYNTTVGDAKEERSHISGKIHNWYAATDQLKQDVDDVFGAALENLRKIAETKVFASMAVPGAGAAGGDPGPGGGDPGQGGPGGGDPGPGGGYPGGGSGGDAAMPQPAQVDPTAAPEPTDPAQAGPPAEQAEPAAADESVTIRDGDRSISVTSPDGEGHVKVTVEEADGKPKSYDLDFDAASGMEPRPGAEGDKAADPGTERVPAGTNGQCVIKDGPLTITAERPLFDPGTIKLEVDDGVSDPTVYTLGFDETPGDADQPADAQADPAKDGAQADGKHDPAHDAAQPDRHDPANADGYAADTKDGGPAEEAQADAESAADNGRPGEKEQLTTPQAVLPGDDPGSQPGPIVPDQSTGEAGLASAGEGEPADSAGNSGAGAMPMMAGAGAGGGVDAGRAGTGWSVHGDLFDNHDPVYSMHGVLGEDDLESR